MADTVDEAQTDAFEDLAAYSWMFVTNSTLLRRALLSFLLDRDQLELIRRDEGELKGMVAKLREEVGNQASSLQDLIDKILSSDPADWSLDDESAPST